MEIKALLSDLQSFNVETFKGYGIEVTFKRQLWTPPSEAKVPGTSFEGATTSKEPAIDPIDPGLSQSLDGEMDYDKILNWSASPDQSLPTPLAGDDLPLTSDI